MASVQERYGKRGVQVIGVHTPEFDQERDPDLVRAASTHLKVTWPVMLDNDSAMWDALGTEAWPSLYVVDKRGRIRLQHVGEIHANTPEARDIETLLDALLREPAGD